MVAYAKYNVKPDFLFSKIFKITFLAILLAEFLSFFGYFYPAVNKAAFLAIVITALAVSLYKLEYGLLIVFIELIIGSKGYLFYFDAGGFSVSIRIALWLVVMAVWAGKMISWLIKNKKLETEFLKSPYAKYFIILFAFIAWGVINGILRGNSFSNLFFDLNGWLYFLLVFPAYEIMCGAKNVETHCSASLLQNIFSVFTAAIIWLFVKTYFLLFIFSHVSPDTIYEIYRWVRTTGAGEITQIQGGFYRIFFQSHIFVLTGIPILFLIMFYNILNPKSEIRNPKQIKIFKIQNLKLFTFYFLLFTLFFSSIIISYSRSFWVGLVSGLIMVFGYLIWQKIGIKKIVQIGAFLIGAAIVSVGFIVLIVNFPYPKPIGGFATTNLLAERASNLNESAALSRWDLLAPLWQKIKKTPILGQGFGATITYKSSDPRVLQANPSGEYTTYAFEWGWLDIWLKLGVGGLIAYLILIGKIFYDGLIFNFQFLPPSRDPAKAVAIFNSDQNKIILGLTIGLAVVVVVNIFSPYFNHPLGIGYLILVSAILNKSRTF